MCLSHLNVIRIHYWALIIPCCDQIYLRRPVWSVNVSVVIVGLLSCVVMHYLNPIVLQRWKCVLTSSLLLMNVVRQRPRTVLYARLTVVFFSTYLCQIQGQLAAVPSSQLWITISGTSLPWHSSPVGFSSKQCHAELELKLHSQPCEGRVSRLADCLQSYSTVCYLVIPLVYTGSRLKSDEEKLGWCFAFMHFVFLCLIHIHFEALAVKWWFINLLMIFFNADISVSLSRWP